MKCERLDLKLTNEIALTPGGYRPRSKVHRVRQGDAVRRAASEIGVFDGSLGKMRHLAALDAGAEDIPEAPGGWIAWAAWEKPSTGDMLARFKTTWKVPPGPSAEEDQLIYLFNGLQDVESNVAILQPVLQWGESSIGGDHSWNVASWYVVLGDHAFTSGLVPVQPGETITGVMSLLNVGENGRCDYRCEFEGLPGTILTALGVPELVTAYQALEAYSLQDCSGLPATTLTSMSNILLEPADSDIEWKCESDIAKCGQKAVVTNPSSQHGQVDLYYSQGS